MEKVYVTQQDFDEIVKNYMDKFLCLPEETHDKNIVDSIINSGEYSEWFVPQTGDKIYLVIKEKEKDFTRFDYLPDMEGFMKDIRYIFDTRNTPDSCTFERVENIFYQMFLKGELHPEEVKQGFGELFPEFMNLLVRAHGEISDTSGLSGLFETFNGKNTKVKDILPIVADLVKADVDNKPKFELDKGKLKSLANTDQFNFVKGWLDPYLSGINKEQGNIVIDCNSAILLITHIVLSLNFEFEHNPELKGEFKNVLSKYREIFSVDGTNFSDVVELDSKISYKTSMYSTQTTIYCPEKDEDVVDKSWYESGLILGSPENQKLFSSSRIPYPPITGKLYINW